MPDNRPYPIVLWDRFQDGSWARVKTFRGADLPSYRIPVAKDEYDRFRYLQDDTRGPTDIAYYCWDYSNRTPIYDPDAVMRWRKRSATRPWDAYFPEIEELWYFRDVPEDEEHKRV